jgi:hypothetical protein
MSASHALTATRCAPVESEATPVQSRIARNVPAVVFVQVTPESLDVQRSPPVERSTPFRLAATRWVPSELDATEAHAYAPLFVACWVQVTPELLDVQIPEPTAINLVPVASEATDIHVRLWAAPDAVWSVQVAPESLDVQMSPTLPGPPAPRPNPVTAINLVPVASAATDIHVRLWAAPDGVWSVQVTPALLDVQMSPPQGPPTAATRWVPVESEATEVQ